MLSERLKPSVTFCKSTTVAFEPLPGSASAAALVTVATDKPAAFMYCQALSSSMAVIALQGWLHQDAFYVPYRLHQDAFYVP
jgi:hypothetical protein